MSTRQRTTTVVTSSVSPSAFGQSVTFTATVAASAPGAGTPAGTVTFKQGSNVLGTITLDANGQATFTTTALPVGSLHITAAYSGSVNWSASTSPALTQTVTKDNTATALTSSSDPSVNGHSVTFTATVTANAPGGGIPSGKVAFMDGTKKLGAVALDATGHASFATSKLAIGNHKITAVYKGSSDDNTSTSPVVVQTVNSLAQAQRAARRRRRRLRASGVPASSLPHSLGFRSGQS